MANDNYNESPTAEQSELLRQRREKLTRLRQRGEDPFRIVGYERTHLSNELHDCWESLAGQTVRIAGRLMARRRHGKATFADLQDDGGKIQILFRLNRLGEESYESLAELDDGDIIGVEGDVFRTRTGEITVSVASYKLLAKALRPLPEKWHGLRDIEIRYRQRYLDLIANEDSRKVFVIRSKVVRAFRSYLDKREFLEVETPMMQAIPGGALARPFVTHHNALDIDFYLRIAPELYLKRLIMGGFERVYELGRVFRNEGISTRHNPEFTMLEAYQAYADYRDMMELIEGMVAEAAQEALGRTVVEWEREQVELAPPWERLTLAESLARYAGLEAERVDDREEVLRKCAEAGLPAESDLPLSTAINNLFERFVQPKLIQPTFIIDYPTAISPLAKAHPDKPSLAQRFEPFVGGLEIGNAFSELNDPDEQRKRFEEQVRSKAAGDEEAHPMDEDYLRALEYGMPPTGGFGIGIERVVMLLTGAQSIRDVILFPHMRPETR